ncbi:MAG: cellulase family glycosylhydrolase [Bacteroidota bacterium]
MRILTTLLLIFSLAPVFAQLTPAVAIEAMGRGINLGNTLEPPLEGDWNNGPAQESYFDAYVAAGFTNVRIPVRWDRHTQEFAPYTVDEEWMDRVEEVVDWGLSRGLYVTLNGHHEDWLKEDYSSVNRSRYDNIWRQIIARFKDKSDKLLYEIINEPNGLTVQQVNDLNARILGIIRAEEPTRLVIFGGNKYSNVEELIVAAIPDDDYLIGYYHSYDPWPFAGEANGTWGTPADYLAMASKFQRARNWSDQKGIPVYVSEYNARVEGDYNSRMRWLGEYMGQADKHGFATSAWDDGGWFKILNRFDNVWPAEKDIHIHYYQDSPHNIFSSAIETGDDQLAALVEWENRLTGNDSILLEKAVGINGDFTVLTTLAPDATAYTDEAVAEGGTYTYRMYTTDADGRLVHGYPTRLRLTPTTGGGVQASFQGTPIPIPGTLEVEDYDTGGEGVAYHDTDAANQGGGYRLDEGVDIGGGPNGSGFVLGYVANGEWLEFTVNVAETGTYSLKANVASADAASNFQITFPNGASTTFSTPVTGDWNSYREINASGNLELAAGEQIVRLTISGNRAFNLDDIIFTLESTATEAEAIRAGFTLAPNPAREVITANLPASFSSGGNLSLFNAAGALVKTQAVNGSSAQITVEDLPAGAYTLRLSNGKRTLVRRVVVQ